MALTLDLLNAQENLSGLTDEQKTALVGLSERDEETTFNRRFGETLGQMDTVIASEGAIGRNEGEKTSEYMARVIRTLKSSADEGAGYKTANESLTAEIESLKQKIASGAGNEEIKKELDKLRGELASAKKVNGELQESLTKKEADYKGKLEGYRMESEIGAAMTGIALKKELPEATKQALLTLAKQNVMASKHVFDETAGLFIFQDADGNPLKDKSLNNLTVSAMLLAELEKMGVLETGRNQGGAGGNGNAGGSVNGSGAGISITTAKTKVEADEIIARELMAQGHARSDANWYELVKEAKDANRAFYDTLPLS